MHQPARQILLCSGKFIAKVLGNQLLKADVGPLVPFFKVKGNLGPIPVIGNDLLFLKGQKVHLLPEILHLKNELVSLNPQLRKPFGKTSITGNQLPTFRQIRLDGISNGQMVVFFQTLETNFHDSTPRPFELIISKKETSVKACSQAVPIQQNMVY